MALARRVQLDLRASKASRDAAESLFSYLAEVQASAFGIFADVYIYIMYTICVYIYIPASSKGCCLNPKGWWIGTPYHPFNTPWKIQVYIYM